MQTHQKYLIASPETFTEWSSLNDSIMGGSSEAVCISSSQGLSLEGDLVEEGGGFVSCRSPLLTPPLNLSDYRGLEFCVDGEGRTLKIALACQSRNNGLSRFFGSALRWVSPIPTDNSGTTYFQVLFNNLEPTIRAKKISIPLRFNSAAITQIQLLHSKFGQPGMLNPGFRPGQIKVLLRSISAFS